MGRRSFTLEFKVEAVKLVRERGVTIAQASRDLGLHPNVLRKWVKDSRENAEQAFPGRGKQRPDDAEVSRLRQELAKTKAERDILKKAIALFAKEPRDLADEAHVPVAGSISWRVLRVAASGRELPIEREPTAPGAGPRQL